MCENKATLYGKIAQVMGKIGRVKEAGKHGTQKWRYATAEDVKDEIRGAMASVGLALLVNLDEYEFIPLKDKGVLLRGKMAFTLCCSESGATETRYFWGEAADQSYVSDKAFYKLYTTLEKYYLKTTFLISSGDDLDSDADNTRKAQPATSPRPTPANVNGNGRGQSEKEEFEKFLAKTRIELNLSEEDTKAILKELGYTGFTPAQSDAYFEALESQLNEGVTTEVALFLVANRETKSYYKAILHMRRAIKKIDPGFDYPPAQDDPAKWKAVLKMLIDHAQAGTDKPEQAAMLVDQKESYYTQE